MPKPLDYSFLDSVVIYDSDCTLNNYHMKHSLATSDVTYVYVAQNTYLGTSVWIKTSTMFLNKPNCTEPFKWSSGTLKENEKPACTVNISHMYFLCLAQKRESRGRRRNKHAGQKETCTLFKLGELTTNLC